MKNTKNGEKIGKFNTKINFFPSKARLNVEWSLGNWVGKEKMDEKKDRTTRTDNQFFTTPCKFEKNFIKSL